TFFSQATPATETYTLSLHDALPIYGLPPNPGGWITTTARNRAIDRLRREARGQKLLSEVAVLTPDSDEPGLPEETRPVQDDRLRSEEHTSELQSRENLVCRLLLEKK